MIVQRISWVTLTPLLLFLCGCQAEYVIRSSYFQLELLSYRVPLDEAIQDPEYTPFERDRLRDILRAQRYATARGLQTGSTYTSVAGDWPRELFNISACKKDAFEPVTWTFPLVGTVPYLGFFRRQDAYPILRELKKDPNVEVYARHVGAYSTLGYFDDPILPSMLTRDRFGAIQTVFHELAHGTLWLKGSVGFNESFASFIGELLAFDYFKSLGVEGEAIIAKAEQRKHDRALFVQTVRGLYTELDQLYREPLPLSAKLARKAALIQSLPRRMQAVAFIHPEPYIAASDPRRWNNARLIQFKAYNDLQPQFWELYRAYGEDLERLLEVLSALPSEAAFTTLVQQKRASEERLAPPSK